MKIITCFIITLCLSTNLHGQWEITGSLKLEVGLNWLSKTYISFSAAAGVKRQMFYDKDKYGEFFAKFTDYSSTGFQTGFNLYYNGIGDNILDSEKKTRFDFVSSILISFGTPAKDTLFQDRQKVRTFNSFIANPISDDYHHSISVGSNVVLNSDRRNQITGFTNVNIARVVRFGYMNDGPPFGTIGLADRYDRWWTGSGFVEVFLDQGYVKKLTSNFLDSKFLFTFDRFTGNVQEAFEVSNLLGFSYVPDADLKKNYFNRARVKVGYEAFDLGYQVSYQRIGHLLFDFQNMIHKNLVMPYHLTHASPYNLLGLQSTNHLNFH